MAVDTNVLVRAAVRDDRAQAEIATKWLRNSEPDCQIAVSCLCEFVWVLAPRLSLSRLSDMADGDPYADFGGKCGNQPAGG